VLVEAIEIDRELRMHVEVGDPTRGWSSSTNPARHTAGVAERLTQGDTWRRRIARTKLHDVMKRWRSWTLAGRIRARRGLPG